MQCRPPPLRHTPLCRLRVLPVYLSSCQEKRHVASTPADCELKTGLAKRARALCTPDLVEAHGADPLCMQCVMDTPFEVQAELARGKTCGADSGDAADAADANATNVADDADAAYAADEADAGDAADDADAGDETD
eukprot:2256027-Pleurochrysis_carterae.AAC.1